VSGRCFPGTLDRGVCLEEIDLVAAGDPLGGGAGAWTPLLARDIPTFLWIAGSWTPEGNVPLEAATYADKLIVDSSQAGDPSGGLAALHRLREATRDRLVVADFAWSRTLPLRVQAARAFDPPDARDALDRLAAVRLEGATRSEAQLFFLWLACRLGWRLLAGRDGPSFGDAAGRTVSLIHENPAPLARGARLSFDARGMAIDVTCSANGCASVGEDRGPWRIAPDGELLLAEVDTLKQDALLDDALGLADRSSASIGSGAGDREP
jgi:glucose-6-phosphate dehydrogenase assembly protein OpcA